MTAHRTTLGAAGIFLAALLCSGCFGRAEPPNATWQLSTTPSATDSHLQISVVRAECSGGFTGVVDTVRVEATAQEVMVSVSVQALEDGAYDCPENETVPYTVPLGEPLGQRSLIDGYCRYQALGGTSMCSDGGLRYAPGNG